jgi:Na+/H+ antiporter NhaD/arsenite permease-like protein
MMFWFATVVFFGTYILIASEKVHKTTAALIGSALMLLFVLEGPSHGNGAYDAGTGHKLSVSNMVEKGVLESSSKYEKLDIFAKYVNFDVIFTLAGMMLLVNVLSGTGIFQYVAIKCAKISRGSPLRTLILLVVATAVLSAFLDNVTTVLLIAPVTLVVASELDVPAIPFLMAETMASNIGGTATLIGDPPNLIIGSVAHLDFAAFMLNLAPFIAVILTIYCVGLRIYYGKKMSVTVEKRARIMELDEKAAITDSVNMRRGGIVMLITILGFLIHGAVGLQPCVVAMSGAALALGVCKVDVDYSLEKIEWSTLFFFMGLFILVSGADYAGLMAEFGSLLSFTGGWNPLATVLVVMWISGISAALMNNVSFTAAMVTIIAGFLHSVPVFRESVANQHLMWWGLALAVCLGGNGTVVGAAANLVTVGIAEKAGHDISFRTFFRYGFPVTLISLVAASFYIIIRYFALCR